MWACGAGGRREGGRTGQDRTGKPGNSVGGKRLLMRPPTAAASHTNPPSPPDLHCWSVAGVQLTRGGGRQGAAPSPTGTAADTATQEPEPVGLAYAQFEQHTSGIGSRLLQQMGCVSLPPTSAGGKRAGWQGANWGANPGHPMRREQRTSRDSELPPPRHRWSAGQGLGRQGQGRPEPLRASRRPKQLGLGHDAY